MEGTKKVKDLLATLQISIDDLMYVPEAELEL
jgi:hypothetical protein